MHLEAIALIERLKPYGGGNDWFYRLSEVDNADKHRLLIATFSAPQSIPFKVLIPPNDTRKKVDFRIYPSQGFSIEDGATVAVIRDMAGNLAKVEMDGEPAFFIIFNQPAIVANIEISEFLGNSVSLVEDVINQTNLLIDRLYPHPTTSVP